MNDASKLRSEMNSVLADDTFVRSPVMARLLSYLVEATITGEGRGLKSYSVAVDGLGRSADYDSQIDTYARVQVGRLRKALDVYYATRGAGRAERLQVESGSYEVQLIPNRGLVPETSELTIKAVGSPARRLSRFRIGATVAVAVAALLMILSLGLWYHKQSSLERWRTSNFPTVAVLVEGDTGGKLSASMIEDVRKLTLVLLSRYGGVGALLDSPSAAKFTIRIMIDAIPEGLREEVFVEESASNRIIWSEIRDFRSPAGWASESEAYHQHLVHRIGSLSGVIHSYQQRYHGAASTPYGCWLRFAAQIQGSRDPDDEPLEDCSRDWYEASPSHPAAAGLKGWVLIDQSLTSFTEYGRRAKLVEAIGVLEQNAAMNPSSAFAQVSLMRAYSHAGNVTGVYDAGMKALTLNPTNVDLEGLVGTAFALNNHPQGEAMVKEAIAGHFNPPPWFFVGAFVGAMMRDDADGARVALGSVSEFRHSYPVVSIMSAALEARSGHIVRAKALWTKAQKAQPLLRLQPKLLFDRMPLAPAVKQRLLLWLKPVIES